MKQLNHLPSLNALKAFEAASRHLNFKLAAEELNVTQSAIAQHIRRLEEELGLKLFKRHAKGVSLTANGRSYSHSITQAFNLIHEATQSFYHSNQQITISVTPTFAAKWLIPRLSQFTQSHPDIDLQILATEKISHFQNDGVDLAIRYGKPPFGAGLNTELLLQDTFIAVASPELMNTDQQYLDIHNLDQFTLLHDANNLWTHFIEKLKPQHTQNLFKNIRFNQTSLAIDAAIAAQGITLTNPIFVSSDLETGKLIKVFNQTLSMETGFYLVYPRHASNIEVLAKVRNWLFTQFS
jgi:LysR family transcriptional regulator, glycine cleavage system transcriptional activator